MAEMEFLKENILNTTTMVSVDSNTGTARYLFDRNTKLGYSSSGYNSTTATTIIVTFDETTPVSHILLQNHNIKQYNIYYDTVTAANSIASATVNSDTSTYLSFNTISAANIKLVLTDTIDGSEEKSIGELVITEKKMVFDRNPNALQYNPFIARKQIAHMMPDGGISLFNIKDKFRAKISLRYITTSFYNNLFSVYDEADPVYFIPFPTATSWDGKGYPVNWVGEFNFKFAENTKNNYSGDILLREIPSG
jgi:hypothetical protein